MHGRNVMFCAETGKISEIAENLLRVTLPYLNLGLFQVQVKRSVMELQS